MVAQNKLRDARERAAPSAPNMMMTLPPQSYDSIYNFKTDEELGFWDIKYDDLVLGEFLGKGAFGEVFVCHLGASSGAVKMAVKFFKGNNSTDSQEEFVKETDFMKKLSHPFVLQFYG